MQLFQTFSHIFTLQLQFPHIYWNSWCIYSIWIDLSPRIVKAIDCVIFLRWHEIMYFHKHIHHLLNYHIVSWIYVPLLRNTTRSCYVASMFINPSCNTSKLYVWYSLSAFGLKILQSETQNLRIKYLQEEMLQLEKKKKNLQSISERF